MPFDQGDAECLGIFIETCAKLNALYSEQDAVHFVVAGDFNCQSGSRFYNIFIQWANDLNLQLSDIKRLDNAFTYCSDDGLRSSWIDHCVCSNDVDQLI
jgi:endonuclease/exonuclease/phosphatase family metal-dependent hydrolase